MFETETVGLCLVGKLKCVCVFLFFLGVGGGRGGGREGGREEEGYHAPPGHLVAAPLFILNAGLKAYLFYGEKNNVILERV